MKKINIVIMAMLAAFSAQTMIASAASIAVKSDSASISYTYSLENENEAVFNAEKLFSKLDEVSVEEGVKETFTITNNADNGNRVEMVLRMELDSVSDNWTYSPLDYYSFVINDENGNVIYDSATADLSEAKETSKIIVLGEFNENNSEDTKIYTIEYKLSVEGVKNLTPEDVSGLTISFGANKIDMPETEAAEVETATAPPRVAKPKYELSTESEPTPETETKTEPTDMPATETPVNEKKFICGKDITPGRYVVKGNGVVKVESELGVLESESIVNDGTVEGIEGSASAVITLSEGDVVTLSPLAGQEKASVTVEKTNSGSSGTGSNTVRENPTGTTGKTNPKTGEESTSMFVIIMIAAVAGIVTVEIVKRKRVK